MFNNIPAQTTNKTGKENSFLASQPIENLRAGDRSSEGTSPTLDLALEVLECGDFQERWEVAKLLPAFGKEAIAPLTEILEDEDDDLDRKWFAGRILGELDCPEAIAALVNLLRTSNDEDLAAIAASALANLGQPAIGALTELLERPESRFPATRALAQIRSCDTIEPLLLVVRDPDRQVRATAIEALGSFGDPRLLSVLIAALKDPAALVRKEAAIALGSRSPSTPEVNRLTHLQPLLDDVDLEVCQQAAIAISKLRTNEAANALFNVLSSPHTPIPLQVSLIQSLGWMATPSSLQYLQQSLPVVSEASVLEIVRVLGRIELATLHSLASDILLDWFKSNPLQLENSAIKQAFAHACGQLGISEASEVLLQLKEDANSGVKWHAIAALKRLQNLRKPLRSTSPLITEKIV